MKNLFFALFAVVAFGLTSCGDSGCDLDLTGVYTGTMSCAGIETEETVTVTGSEGDYTVVASGQSEGSVEQDGCTLKYEVSLLGVGESITYEFSEGSVSYEQKLAGVTGCTFTGTK